MREIPARRYAPDLKQPLIHSPVASVPPPEGSQVDSDDVQELLDFHNQELTIDKLIEMHGQEQDIERSESLDLVLAEDRMSDGNLTEGLSLIE
ncbi:hypothetical protein TNCV_1757861 [Trichonephila clavipes]|nr:hypothetical protein TNCV_1757861 [Trichonephila clavipes]